MKPTSNHRPSVGWIVGLFALMAFVPFRSVQAQTAQPRTITLCVTSFGAVYLIQQPGLPDVCRSDEHVEITLQVAVAGESAQVAAAPPPGAGPQVVLALNLLSGDLTLTGSGGTTITNDGVGEIEINTFSGDHADLSEVLPDQHHPRYADDDAVAAMGTADNPNPLNHDRYAAAEATTAMGVAANENPLNHDRYTDDEAIAAVGPSSGWSLSGNGGTTPSTDFIGTTDNQPLEFRVNGLRVLRLEPTEQNGNSAPNLIGGSSGNGVGAGVVGATIGGGGFLNDRNQVLASFGTIGGGLDNTTGGTFSTVAGGHRGAAIGTVATVGGGQVNTASGPTSTVGGGDQNTASSSSATVAGGSLNTASGSFTFVGGGRENAATALSAVVAGGTGNTASSLYATVPGGNLNVATGQYSFAAGRRAKANQNGTFVWADHKDEDFASTAADQFLIRARGGVGIGTDNPGSPLTVAGIVESTGGGFKFPDGSVQTTAATGGGASDHGSLNGLADDDHPQYVLADGVRSTTNGFAVTGTFGTGAIPVSGAGARLMWYPRKAAFRVGRATASQWDDVNIGLLSTAMGGSTTASGTLSTAMGQLTNASGGLSTAMGSFTTASGFRSTAMGDQTTASGNISTAMGQLTNASGLLSTAMGRSTTAAGSFSTAMGANTTASGSASTAMGGNTNASGGQSTAMGGGTTASGTTSTAMGGNTNASGTSSTAMGDQTTASGDFTTAMGRRATTNGREGSFVYGDNTLAFTSVIADNSFVVRAQRVWFGKGSQQVATAGRYIETSTGAFLSDGGVWTNSSDRDRKEHFRDEDGEAVLERIADLRIQSWSYKAEDRSVRHLGPTAQDFYAAFELGDSDKAIATVDIDGVNLLAIQALEARTRDLDDVRAELAETRQRLAALEAALAKLETVTEANQR